jgi:hypothetical protein
MAPFVFLFEMTFYVPTLVTNCEPFIALKQKEQLTQSRQAAKGSQRKTK